MKVVMVAGFLALLAAQRHRVVGAIRELKLLPGSMDRVAAASARVRPLLTVELAAMKLRLGDPVFLRVLKEEQFLEVWMKPRGEPDFVHYKTYVLCRPGGVPGPRNGDQDQQLPEGFYAAARDSLRPYHRHYLAFDIGYPNEVDRHLNRPPQPVLVQGDCVGAGSLALNNPNIEELYTLVSAALDGGQKRLQVHLFPFRLTDEKMNQLQTSKSPWLEFWANLKEGYDYFEIVRRPPRISFKAGRYAFE